VSGQQDGAHQIACPGQRPAQIAHLVGRAAEVVEQERRVALPPVGRRRAAPRIRRQLERRPVADDVRRQRPLAGMIDAGDRALCGGGIGGEVAGRHRNLLTRGQMAPAELAWRRARGRDEREQARSRKLRD
jgi:hypothetical protein